MNGVPTVAILVDTSTGWGRRLIRGVAEYADKYGPWDIWLEPHGQCEKLRLPNGWRGEGVIARLTSQSMVAHLEDFKVPVVNVSSIRIPRMPFPKVTTDTDSHAEMALTHFRERGITNLGYVGLNNQAYSLDRQHAFQHACEEAHCDFAAYTAREPVRRSAPWTERQQALQTWLKSTSKPIGILSWDVQRGLDVARAAHHCGLSIPDDVAILCGDDDELLCETNSPPLSGIIVASEQIGREAACVLHKLISGQSPPEEPLLIKPSGIHGRASTDLLAIDDPDIVAAIRYIRANAHRPIRVDDVAKAVAVSRRVLERRFHKVLQVTVGEQIARSHIERAKRLLIETDMPVPAVAEASGFGSPEYLSTVFRKTVGLTPFKYRSQAAARL